MTATSGRTARTDTYKSVLPLFCLATWHTCLGPFTTVPNECLVPGQSALADLLLVLTTRMSGLMHQDKHNHTQKIGSQLSLWTNQSMRTLEANSQADKPSVSRSGGSQRHFITRFERISFAQPFAIIISQLTATCNRKGKTIEAKTTLAFVSHDGTLQASLLLLRALMYDMRWPCRSYLSVVRPSKFNISHSLC